MGQETRPVEVVKHRPLPLRVREGDIPEQALGYVLARCWYCHEEYIPVKISDYSPVVVYNCGCHKEPIDKLNLLVYLYCGFFIVALIVILTLLAAWR